MQIMFLHALLLMYMIRGKIAEIIILNEMEMHKKFFFC